MGYDVTMVLEIVSLYGGEKKLDSIEALALLVRSKHKHEVFVAYILEEVARFLGPDFDEKSLSKEIRADLEARMLVLERVIEDLKTVKK
jgi:hypothetical protein